MSDFPPLMRRKKRMKLNFNLPITNLAGKNLKEDVVDDKGIKTGTKDLTLGTISIAALLNQTQEEKPTAQDKVLRAKIAHKIYDAIEDKVPEEVCPVDLKVEEVNLIKTRIGEMYGALVVSCAYDLIETGAIVNEPPALVKDGDTPKSS